MSDRIFSQEEIAALDRAERELAKVGLWSGLDNEKGKSNADTVVKYFTEWNPTISITPASIKQCIELLTQKGLLHWKSQAQMAFESAAQGLSDQQLATLSSGLSQYSLITEGDEGLENKVAMLGYLQGRSIDHATIFQGASYLQAKGAKLHWKPMPSQSTRKEVIMRTPLRRRSISCRSQKRIWRTQDARTTRTTLILMANARGAKNAKWRHV